MHFTCFGCTEAPCGPVQRSDTKFSNFVMHLQIFDLYRCTCTYVHHVQVQEQNKHFFKVLTALARDARKCKCIDTNLRFVSASQGASAYFALVSTLKKCLFCSYKPFKVCDALTNLTKQSFVQDLYLYRCT